MRFLQDNLIPFFKNRQIVFRESRKETEDVVSFLFDKPSDLNWRAGQYGLFTITHKKIKNPTKPFSVSSAPAEDVIRITTVIKDQPSEYKQALLELTPGMTVSMRGPVGPFYLKDDASVLFIAGGIGITPFRSILKQLEAEGKGKKQIQLVLVDSDKRQLFKDELDQLAAQSLVSITYLDSRDRFKQEMDQIIAPYRKKGKIMLAGPQSMVNQLFVDLTSKRISKNRIIKDSFFGY
jgi:ferredoxin-NADP reductase